MKVTKDVVNKTHEALRVPLPHGKILHLGPGQTGQVSVHSLDHPPLKELLAAQKIEIMDAPEHDLMLPPEERAVVA